MVPDTAGILVVAPQRDVRRAVFDVLDAEGHSTIHTARGLPHAQILLDGRGPLMLIVLVFGADASDAQAHCEQLRRIPACAEAPLIAVLADEATVTPMQLPEDVSGWLYASQVERELVVRWQQSVAPASQPGGGPTDFHRFAFEETDSEWLVVNPASGCVLEVSPAVARHSRLERERWPGRRLQEVLAFEGIEAAHVLEQADRRWYACHRRSIDGADTGQASARRIRYVGGEAIALLFRSDRADVSAEAALNLLSRIFAAATGIDTQKVAVRLLLDELGLDYLALWSARPEDGSGLPTQLAQLWRGDEQEWPALGQQTSLRKVFEGRTLLFPADATGLAPDDKLIQQLQLASFAALPLFDERRTVLGALVAGSRARWGDMGIIEPLLRCAAARFAHRPGIAQHPRAGRAPKACIDA